MDLSTVNWYPTSTPGVLQSTLNTFGDGASQTNLMNLQAETRTEPHAHTSMSEEIFVLEGSFQDDDGTYGPGDYCCRPAGKAHRAWTHAGCVAIVIYRWFNVLPQEEGVRNHS